MVKNYYKILGVNKAASEDDIKKAYRKMALKFHPDKNKDADAEERFKEIAEAYEVLSDNKKKYKYDHSSRRNSTPSNNHNWSFSFRPTDPFDLFKNFFNGQDPFSDGFHDSLFNLHRQHHNSIFGRDPFFSQSKDFPDTSKPFIPRTTGNVTASLNVKTETSYKTGDDGTVHITRTVIGKDGSVSKEFRFRSTSCKGSEDEPKNVFQRQTSEPVKNYTKLDSISEVLQRDVQRQQSSPGNNFHSEPGKDSEIFSNGVATQPQDVSSQRSSPQQDRKLSETEKTVPGNISRKRSEKILEDISNLVLKEAESLTEQLSTLTEEDKQSESVAEKEDIEKDKSKQNDDLLPEPFKKDNESYQSVYNIEAEVVKEEVEKCDDVPDTEGSSTAEVKSSPDSELPPNSFYQTSVPSPLAQAGADTSSMLDFCISRSREGQGGARGVYKFQPQVRKPSLVRNRKKSYKRSKSYAGGTVSLSQCPLCARLFERSVIEDHAASCPGLCDPVKVSEDSPERPTCPLCGQRFSRDKIEQHAQYCGEVEL